MPREPLEPGTFGTFKTVERGTRWQARCLFRDHAGVYSRPSAAGATKASAESALKRKLSDLISDSATSEINSNSWFTEVAELWYAEKEREADAGDLAVNSLRNYRGYLDNHIYPAMSKLRISEVRGYRCDKFIKAKNDKSYALAKGTRNVLSGVCEFAVRWDAIKVNPVKSIARLVGAKKRRKKPMGLQYDDRVDLLEGMQAFGEAKLAEKHKKVGGRRVAIWTDLPDILRAMLATGVRIGEVLACTGNNFYRDRQGYPCVAIEAHIIRVTGVGLVREEHRKNDDRVLIVRVPEWSVPVFNKRKLASGGDGPLFSNAGGGWLDPSNTINRLRAAFEGAGYGWITSHIMRKTVGMVLDEAGLTTTEIADQLGDDPATVERHYRPRRVSNPRAVAALEGMLPAVGDEKRHNDATAPR